MTPTYTHCKKIPKKQAKAMPTMPPPTIAISYSGFILLIVGFFSCSCKFSRIQIIQFSFSFPVVNHYLSKEYLQRQKWYEKSNEKINKIMKNLSTKKHQTIPLTNLT